MAKRNQKTNGAKPQPTPINVAVHCTDIDVENMIAFGNRANMTGAEADVWFMLKQILGGVLIEARQGIQKVDKRIETPVGLD